MSFLFSILYFFPFAELVFHNSKKPQTKQRSHESWSIVVDSRLDIKIGLLGSFMRNPNRFFEGFFFFFYSLFGCRSKLLLQCPVLLLFTFGVLGRYG